MSTHLRLGLRDVVLNSVRDGVLRGTRTPILLVPADQGHAAGGHAAA